MRYLFLVLFALPVFGQVLMPSQNFYAHYVDGRVEIERPPSVSPPPAAENTHLVLIQADFRLDYVYAHNETPDRDETLVNPNANYIEIPLTKNYYTFICGYWPDNTTHYVIVRDSIWVDSDIDLNLALSEARWQVNYDVQDERGRPLAVSIMAYQFRSRLKDLLFLADTGGLNAEEATYFFNKEAKSQDCYWTIESKETENNGDLYLVSGTLPVISQDSVYHVHPTDYAFSSFSCTIPDSVPDSARLRFGCLLAGFSRFSTIYQESVELRTFQNINENVPLLGKTFTPQLASQLPVPGNFFIFNSQRLQFTRDKLVSYFIGYNDEFPKTPIEIPGKDGTIRLGVMPVYWFGKFYNTQDSIKIRSPYTIFDYLFLCPTQDVPNHDKVAYQLFRNENLLKKGRFPKYGYAPLMMQGFNPDSMTFAVTPDRYRLEVENRQYYFHGIHGTVSATASFDLATSDRNPPNFISFQIFDEEGLQDILDVEKSYFIRFIVEDDVAVDSVSLSYATYPDSNWQSFDLYPIDQYWQCQFSGLEIGDYSLKLEAFDAAGNAIENIMAPAFRVSKLTGLGDDEPDVDFPVATDFQLLPAYPNPFNATVHIPFDIPMTLQGDIRFEIFDILGKRIKTFAVGRPSLGSGEVIWDGKNEQEENVPSGVYFARMRFGGQVLHQKLLLIR